MLSNKPTAPLCWAVAATIGRAASSLQWIRSPQGGRQQALLKGRACPPTCGPWANIKNKNQHDSK
eukprot:4156228-Pyramimonas_sp.AAC.1